MSGAQIEHLQRVSALSAAASTGTSFEALDTINKFLEVVSYRHVSIIVKWCKRAGKVNGCALTANTGGVDGGSGSGGT